MAMNGKITLVSNQKGGEISTPAVAKGTTVDKMLYAQYGASVDPDKYMVTVNGAVVKDLASCKLADEDFVVISPKNIKGN